MPVDPSIISGAISASAGLASSLINNQYNKKLAENAYRQNLQMWREQQSYNSPLSQVARLREAGLNPAIAYGGNGEVVGNSTEAPQLDYGGVYSQPLVNPQAIAQGFEAMSVPINLQLMQSQKDYNDAKTITELREGVLKGIDIKYADDTAKEMLSQIRLKNDQIYMDTQRLSKVIDYTIATKNLTGEQIKALEFANEFADRTMEYRIEATQLQNLATKKSFQQIDAVISKYKADTSLVFQNIRSAIEQNKVLPSILQNNLNEGLQKIENLKSTNSKIDAEIRKIAIESGLDYMELSNWFWYNAPNVIKYPGAAVGAVVDSKSNPFNLNFNQ